MNAINLHYYSERGLVDYLITWLKYEANNKDIECFFQLLEEDLVDDYVLDVYNEFSFGEFGNPDLILKLNTNKCTKVFIIEAKLDTFEKSATKIEERSNYKDNASKINIQLLLRKKFITILNKDSKRLFLEEKGYTTKNGRALDKKELVKWANKEIKGDYQYYYVALVRNQEDKSKIWKNYFNFEEEFLEEKRIVLSEKELMLLSWDDLNKIFSSNPVYKEIWDCTDMNYFANEE